MSKVNSYATSIGFSADEVAKTKDSRILQMAIDAAYGREAREAAQKAKAQVKSSGVVKPVSAGVRPHANSMKALERANAMKRLQKTGSLQDAMKLNFE
jgi:hypothetical protein